MHKSGALTSILESYVIVLLGNMLFLDLVFMAPLIEMVFGNLELLFREV